MPRRRDWSCNRLLICFFMIYEGLILFKKHAGIEKKITTNTQNNHGFR